MGQGLIPINQDKGHKEFVVGTNNGAGWIAAHEMAAADQHGAFISVIDAPRPDTIADQNGGALSYVAFAVKDNIDAKDLPTTGGTEPQSTDWIGRQG